MSQKREQTFEFDFIFRKWKKTKSTSAEEANFTYLPSVGAAVKAVAKCQQQQHKVAGGEDNKLKLERSINVLKTDKGQKTTF